MPTPLPRSLAALAAVVAAGTFAVGTGAPVMAGAPGSPDGGDPSGESPFDDPVDPDTTGTTVPAPSEPAPPVEEPPLEQPPADGDGEEIGDEGIDRPSVAPQVRNSGITSGAVVAALVVLATVALVAAIAVRRQPARKRTARAPQRPIAPVTTSPPPSPSPPPTPSTTRVTGIDTAALELLVDVGEALIDAGDAVGHIEATLRGLGRVYGIDGLGVLVLPTALVVSAPGVDDITTEVGTAGRQPLRLDQIDDVIALVRAAERGEVSPSAGSAELDRIRSSPPPYGPELVRLGFVFSSVGIALVLRGGWREALVAAVLGFAVGELRRATQRTSPSWTPFWPLLTATAVSTAVFALARVIDDLAIFPALAAPLIVFLPGALLTTAVLELATGQIVAGAARIASGALQLLLLAIGIVAGGQLLGVPSGDIRPAGSGALAEVLPWVGVAVFGLGVVWFKGARPSTMPWILMAMYTAYAGQVLGGLFFGSALSAFFGAAAMTPVALIAARQPSGPTPLVTFLPGFWLLVPGALGLEGVTRIISDDGGGTYGSAALTTTIVSMVGISLGILFGLLLGARDADRPWADPTAD